MVLISYLHFFLISLIILLSIFLILTKNPIYSILFLVVIFVISSFILILFEVDFIGLLFIIIYVGAITVLFLFVIMMIDVKSSVYSLNEIYVLFFKFFSFFFFFFSLLFFFSEFNCKDFNSLTVFEKNVDSFSNIDYFGQYLFNFFIPCFIIAGLLLLVAMLGAISLTLKYQSNRKKELVTKQLSKTTNYLSFFN
jgi:NADH-quinone oxidoreductase subunit J